MVPLELHENKLDGIFVAGLQEYSTQQFMDCIVLMRRGERNRFIR